MAVIAEISVGGILYYKVDDIPKHTAPKGSVAILDGSIYDNPLIYVNNNGGTVWLKSISDAYGEIYLYNYTTAIDPNGTQTLGSWYPFAAAQFTAAELKGFTLDGLYNLKYTGDTLVRVISTQASTMRGGPTKWVSFRIGPSLNFRIPTQYNEGFANDNSATCNLVAIRLQTLNKNEYFVPGISPTTVEAGGAASARQYIPRHCVLTASKVDEAISTITFNEGFESGNFTTNTWSVVNNTTNVWVVGTAENNGGTYSAYISNNGGTSATYTNNVANVSHFYKDFTITGNTGDEVYLVFDWKCAGQNVANQPVQYDYGTVVMTTTSTTPVAGTEVSTTLAPTGGDGRLGASINEGKFNSGYIANSGTVWQRESINLTSYIGQTKRIVFSWRNDATIGTNPGFIVDNIKIVRYKW
jgi:hypothetical protein